MFKQHNLESYKILAKQHLIIPLTVKRNPNSKLFAEKNDTNSLPLCSSGLVVCNTYKKAIVAKSVLIHNLVYAVM